MEINGEILASAEVEKLVKKEGEMAIRIKNDIPEQWCVRNYSRVISVYKEI